MKPTFILISQKDAKVAINTHTLQMVRIDGAAVQIVAQGFSYDLTGTSQYLRDRIANELRSRYNVHSLDSGGFVVNNSNKPNSVLRVKEDFGRLTFIFPRALELVEVKQPSGMRIHVNGNKPVEVEGVQLPSTMKAALDSMLV